MLVGGTGIGYFVWNEWNNLSITNVITAILLIGVVGMALDLILARLTRAVKRLAMLSILINGSLMAATREK